MHFIYTGQYVRKQTFLTKYQHTVDYSRSYCLHSYCIKYCMTL